MINSIESAIIRKNNHHFYSQIPPPITLNRSINDTTCTTVTNIPYHHINRKHSHEKPSKKYHIIPTSCLHQPLSLKKTSSNLCNIFHSLSFDNIPSQNADDDPIISDEYQIDLNTNNEQSHTYLDDIQVLSLYNHFNNE
ncbi:unnamed protein product [Adineta steineri]|uniref:Uncharacterized protein n=1 Tax=Adineta steineri TaxID=433720 RepID=A0A819QLD8_9BILA|nr:unnamed protein product [Adineta steineri]